MSLGVFGFSAKNISIKEIQDEIPGCTLNYLESLVNSAVHFDHARNQGVANAVSGGRELVGDPRILSNTITNDVFYHEISSFLLG